MTQRHTKRALDWARCEEVRQDSGSLEAAEDQCRYKLDDPRTGLVESILKAVLDGRVEGKWAHF